MINKKNIFLSIFLGLCVTFGIHLFSNGNVELLTQKEFFEEVTIKKTSKDCSIHLYNDTVNGETQYSFTTGKFSDSSNSFYIDGYPNFTLPTELKNDCTLNAVFHGYTIFILIKIYDSIEESSKNTFVVQRDRMGEEIFYDTSIELPAYGVTVSSVLHPNELKKVQNMVYEAYENTGKQTDNAIQLQGTVFAFWCGVATSLFSISGMMLFNKKKEMIQSLGDGKIQGE